MNLVADLHCHSISSGHAYSSIQELVSSAKNKNYEVIAITDHGVSLQGSPDIFYFGNMASFPDNIDGVRVLKGVEANIIDFEGTIDMPEKILEALDIVIASLHDVCIEPGTISQNTKTIIKALENPNVDIIGHPDNPNFEIDIDEVAAAAKQYGKLIELNNKSFYVRKGAEQYTEGVALAAKKYGVKISCGSDAHSSFEVGNFEIIEKIIKDCGIPEELIINTSKDKVLKHLRLK
ncbi:MAG: phosphatase [Deltaproteobacteria bacterium]